MSIYGVFVDPLIVITFVTVFIILLIAWIVPTKSRRRYNKDDDWTSD